MSAIPTRVDVLVVGAGPTGLMLGAQLGRRGVRTLVIDRHNGPSIQTRALGVQARTLEIYAHLGIADRAIELGTRATGADLWVNGKVVARVPLGDIGGDLSPYPFLLILGQDQNEQLLGESLRQCGMAVQWRTELIGLAQTEEEVTATLRLADGSAVQVTADWVAGCDGARSAVRTLNGIDFVGAPYEHVFFIADTRAVGPMTPGKLNVYLWRRGFHLFFPMRGVDHWRVVGILAPELRAREDLIFDDVVASIRHEVGPQLQFGECSWFSTYRIHHRRAQRFRNGRCFLLGDAAHIHSPVGAQGMNTGLQDAYNLAWKLALVTSRRCGVSMLDSYEAERVPVAERLLRTTDRAFSMIVSDRGLAQFLRTRVLPRALALAMRYDRMRKLAFRTISQIGIHYRTSMLSQTMPQRNTLADEPRAGDRFPWLQLKVSTDGLLEGVFMNLDDKRFNLILIGQQSRIDLASEYADLIVKHEIPNDPSNDRALSRAHIPNPSFYLLRPDGHIGLAGARFESSALHQYMVERLHLQAGMNQ